MVALIDVEVLLLVTIYVVLVAVEVEVGGNSSGDGGHDIVVSCNGVVIDVALVILLEVVVAILMDVSLFCFVFLESRHCLVL